MSESVYTPYAARDTVRHVRCVVPYTPHEIRHNSTHHRSHQHASLQTTPDENLSNPVSAHATALPSALAPSRLAPAHLYEYTDPHAASAAESTGEGAGEAKAGDEGGDTSVDGHETGADRDSRVPAAEPLGSWQLWYFEGHGEALNGTSDEAGAGTAQIDPPVNQSEVNAGSMAGGARDSGAGSDGGAADGGLVGDVATLDDLAAYVPQIASRIKEAETKAEPSADAGNGAGSYSEWAGEHHGEQSQVQVTASGTEGGGRAELQGQRGEETKGEAASRPEVVEVAATQPAVAPPVPPVQDDDASSSDDEL